MDLDPLAQLRVRVYRLCGSDWESLGVGSATISSDVDTNEHHLRVAADEPGPFKDGKRGKKEKIFVRLVDDD